MTSRFCEAFSAISPVRGFGFFETGVALADNALDLGLFCVSDGGGMRRTRLEEGEMVTANTDLSKLARLLVQE